MNYKSLLILAMALNFGFQILNAQPTPVLKKASAHPMQYYLSLPNGWTKEKQWPIVVAVEAAEKEFAKNAQRFADARKDMPFIIVVPINVTNGNQGQKDPAIYPYTPEVWKTIDQHGVCSFDLEGLQQVLKDVRENYHGEEKYFITGFEAGAHLVWAMVFQYPQQIRAAAPVAGNYRSRCMDGDVFSIDPARTKLQIQGFVGELDSLWRGRIHNQWEEARALAVQHGYPLPYEQVVKGKGHTPIPAEILEYFFSKWED